MRKVREIINCHTKYLASGPYKSVLVGIDAIKIMGIAENNTFLNNPV
tara:strand:- start:209 stop:349 length:141 start_codon:yes stop_codon:yes gene_type:complete